MNDYQFQQAKRKYEEAPTRLKQGDWYNGISSLEYRNINDVLHPFQGVKNQFTRTPVWSPGQSIKDKPVIVMSEQGAGDVIWFSRYIPLLKEANNGRPIYLYYPPSMKALLKRLPEVDGFVEYSSSPIVPYKIKSLSLLYLLMEHGVLPKEIPSYGAEGIFRNPNITPEKTDKPKIGLFWKTDNDSWNRPIKIIPDAVIEKFVKQHEKDYTFYSLQLEKTFLPQYLTSPQWHETADKIQALDAVITVDSGVAHMAGSVGVPVYNLLGSGDLVCWRWYPQGEKTYWYNSMTCIWWDDYKQWEVGLDKAIQKIAPKQLAKPKTRRKAA